MSDNKYKEKKIRNYFLLAGPLAFSAFILIDVIGGINFPGYSWLKDPISALFANDSNSLVICIVFSIIFFILAFFSAILIFLISKTKKVNNMVISGLVVFMIALIVGLFGHAFAHPVSYDNDRNIVSYSKTVTKTETVESNTDSSNDNGTNVVASSASDSSASSNTQSKTVIDEEATAKNQEKLQDLLADSGVMRYVIVESIFISLLLISFILILIGSFRKKGTLYVGGVSLVCAIFVLYGLFACYYFALDIYGVSSRFINYTPAIFVAFVCGWAYVTNPDKQITLKFSK